MDDHRLVANAGLLLPATLAQRLNLSQLANQYQGLGRAPGGPNASEKLLTLVNRTGVLHPGWKRLQLRRRRVAQWRYGQGSGVCG